MKKPRIRCVQEGIIDFRPGESAVTVKIAAVNMGLSYLLLLDPGAVLVWRDSTTIDAFLQTPATVETSCRFRVTEFEPEPPGLLSKIKTFIRLFLWRFKC